jgi:Malate/L-lactate dehydrogenases
MADVRVRREELEAFCAAVFEALGMPASQASSSSRILVAADARGIGSHGVARLRRYVEGIRKGVMLPAAEARRLRETPSSFVVDARGGIGLSISEDAMRDVIGLARGRGFACAAVRDSNHFGIAGYYAMMALPHDMIGVAMTNTAALGVPTNGRDAGFGSNPIAIAVPAGTEAPFVLDMATTVVTRGKIETYEREGKALPTGWAVGTRGAGETDPARLLEDMLYQRGGGILPLGGLGVDLGGHKGFGLGVLVDIMTAIASGGVFGKSVMDSAATSARVCHFFAALRIDLLREPAEFKADMDRLLREILTSRPAEGSSEVIYAGLKEHRMERECEARGVPLPESVWKRLDSIGGELCVPLPRARSE